jgi:hypothetical protein
MQGMGHNTVNRRSESRAKSALRRWARPAVIVASAAMGFLGGCLVTLSAHIPLAVTIIAGAIGLFVGAVGSDWILDILFPRQRR